MGKTQEEGFHNLCPITLHWSCSDGGYQLHLAPSILEYRNFSQRDR